MDNICSICGREKEDEFHATINCTKARALREDEGALEPTCRKLYSFFRQGWATKPVGEGRHEGEEKGPPSTVESMVAAR